MQRIFLHVGVLSKTLEIPPLSFPVKDMLWHILEKLPVTVQRYMHMIVYDVWLKGTEALTKQVDASISHNKLKKKM